MMNIKIDKMQYQQNNVSYVLAFLAIFVDAYYLLSVINHQATEPSVTIAVKILLNIAFILIVFLAMIKVKIYKKNWTYVLFGFALITPLRIFYIPLKMFDIEGVPAFYAIHLIIVLAVLTVLLLTSALIAYKKCVTLEKYLIDRPKVV